VVDANGNPVPNATIEFTIASGTGTFVGSTTVTTDANGDAIITLTSTVGGTVDITATVNGTPIVNGSPATVTFTTDPDVSVPDTRHIVITNDALADGVETNSVKAHVVDANGTPLSMKEVFFKIESGNATVLTVQPVLTDANGDATILLASKAAGTVTVTAKVSDKPIVNGSPAKLRFVPIDIYVPRVFTPNNDGTNDVVKPIVVGITTFHYFNIYNRWGNLIFSTKDPNVGWDGRFKGVLQPVETYLWIAEGLDKDKKKITRRGMVSLVR
jgi:gliding motility-associated-like protein